MRGLFNLWENMNQIFFQLPHEFRLVEGLRIDPINTPHKFKLRLVQCQPKMIHFDNLKPKETRVRENGKKLKQFVNKILKP